jgi:phosphoribosylformylglycinamidine synthase
MDPLVVGNVLVMIGRTADEFGGSHLDLVTTGARPGRVPQPDPDAPARYRALHRAIGAGLVVSAHDIAEGGLAVALAEMVIASGLGIETAPPRELGHDDLVVALFAESSSRVILEVAPEHLDALRAVFDEPVTVVGRLTETASLVIGDTVVERDRLCDAHYRRGLEP